MDRPDNEKLPTGNLTVLSRKIGKHKYHVTRLGWFNMMEALRLTEKVLGPALESFLEGDITAILDAQGGDIAKGVSLLVQNFTSETGRELMLMLGKQTMVEVDKRKVWLEEDVMDTWLSQHPEEALKYFSFALEVQFRDFFESPMRELGDFLGAKTKFPIKASQSQNT